MTTCRTCIHWAPNNEAGDPFQHDVALCCRSRTMTEGISNCPKHLQAYGIRPEVTTDKEA